MGGGQGLCGEQEAASGGVISHAGALPDKPTTALTVASRERSDAECSGPSICGPQYAQHAKAAGPGRGPTPEMHLNENYCIRYVVDNTQTLPTFIVLPRTSAF